MAKRRSSPRTHWTPVMLDLLRQWYPIYPAAVVAGALDVSLGRIYSKAKQLGLTKSPEFLASQQSGRISHATQHPAMVASRFQKGLVPWNKGKHIVAGGRSAETRFKPGQMPHTWLPIGSYRLSRTGSKASTLQLQRKVSNEPGPNHVRWHPVTRLVWEEAHGAVPKDHLVIFKPGQHTHVLELITLDRLECITRAENARRNHPRSKSPELAKLVQLKGVITRQVNRIVREHEQKAAP